MVVLALLLATLIRVFLVQAFVIPSGSMLDTLHVGDRVLVNKLTPRFGTIERGDVIVFRDPDDWLGVPEPDDAGPVQSFLQFVGLMPNTGEGHLVKRVIGVGGDEVSCCDVDGRIVINGVGVDETGVIRPGQKPSETEFKVTVPEGSFWVMGDNRGNSGDSRINGTVPEGSVDGRVFLIAWPLDRIQGVGTPDVYSTVPDQP